ncbi:MAG: hybrid sensor histidine kinase/response regulator, partial [Xanthomonadales bacterium]|nr:hybrid sensor histidine kinase/response regulator [Xanthomonadales bacterium]
MWTGYGFVRFDGTKFTLFRHHPNDRSSLAANDVSALLVDHDGHVWAGGEDNGVNRYDPASGGFKHWLHDPANAESLAGDDVMGLAQTSDGSIWVGMYGSGVDQLVDGGTRLVHLRHHADDDASLTSDNVATLHADTQGRLWIGTDHGADVRASDGTLRHVHFAGLAKPPIAWQIDGDGGDVRIATNVGLFVVDANLLAHRLPALADMHSAVYSSFRAANGDLWVGVSDGLRLLVVDGHQYRFNARRLLPGGLPGQIVVNVSSDREGGLWLATVDAGLVYLRPHWRDFTSFRHIPEDADSLQDSRILALAQASDGSLLVGGPDGQLDHLDLRSGAVKHLGKAVGLPSKSINSLLVDRDGRTWVGLQRSLRVLEQGKLTTVGAKVLNNGVVWLLPAPDGGVYAAPTAQGVFHIDENSLKLTALVLADASAAERETQQLLLHQDRLWRASRTGLSRLLPSASQMHFVPGVSRGLVNAFGFHGDDLWLARTDALEHYQLHDGQATLLARIGANKGWPSINFNGLFVDKLGRVWMTSRVGLWRFDPQGDGFRRFSSVDGLPSSSFNGRLIVTAAGTVYAGTTGGIVAFRPAALRNTPSAPALLLTAASVRRHGHTVELPLSAGAFHLGWNDRDLHVTAKALSYIDPATNHYRFRLRGLDTDWVDTGTHGEREFAGLAAGNYRLQIEAAGPSGTWTQLPHAWPVSVAAPPWNTPWAWLAYALAAVMLAWWIWHTFQRRFEQRYHLRMVEQASAAKTTFLATLGHEIRTPMTGVLGMAELLTQTALDPRQRGFVDTIQRSGGVLLKLVNDALDMARIEAGRLPLDITPFDPA